MIRRARSRYALTMCAMAAILTGCGGGSASPIGSTGVPAVQTFVPGIHSTQNVVPFTNSLIKVTIANKKPRCKDPFQNALILISTGGYYLIDCFIGCVKNPNAKLFGKPRVTGPEGKVRVWGYPDNKAIYYQAVSVKGNCNEFNCSVHVDEKTFEAGKVPATIDSCLTRFS